MSLILTEDHGRTRVLTINRPDKLNALNRETIGALSEAVRAADQDPNVRAVVITGQGTKAFVAGADISEFAHFAPAEGQHLAVDGQTRLFDQIENCGTPVIAAVNGFALGGGLELAMACHVRVASSNAKMGLPEVSLGVIPGYGGTQRLPQLIGKGRALEMILTAGMATAEEAYRMGLVNHVVEQESLLPTCLSMAETMARHSPMAQRLAIQAVLAGLQPGREGFQAEIEAFGACFGTAEFREGTGAFLEKRKPQF
jgi:enoyl-CoA hydratase